MPPSIFANKTILVTGGTGSIGSEIVRQLLNLSPKQVRVFSRDETKQFDLSNALHDHPKLSLLVGDIRDKERLNLAMEDVDIVFHAAALKHVVACEKNPFEAVKTNIQGTQNVIDCAFANGVERVIGVSTDKAAGPTSVMGCTKLLAERLMLATYFYKGKKRTKFCYVRFGNVLASRGSVVPLFLKQIKDGGPLTVTNPKMTRFFMSIPDAVSLIFKAATKMQDREIFILKMKVATIGDLAKAVLELVKEHSPSLKGVKIENVGMRPGERLHEKLLTEDESETALETSDMFIIRPVVGFTENDKPLGEYAGVKKATLGDYSSKNQRPLGIGAIKSMLESIPDISFKLE